MLSVCEINYKTHFLNRNTFLYQFNQLLKSFSCLATVIRFQDVVSMSPSHGIEEQYEHQIGNEVEGKEAL